MVEGLGNEESGVDEVGNDDMTNVTLWKGPKGNVSSGRFNTEETAILTGRTSMEIALALT